MALVTKCIVTRDEGDVSAVNFTRGSNFLRYIHYQLSGLLYCYICSLVMSPNSFVLTMVVYSSLSYAIPGYYMVKHQFVPVI